MAPQPRRWSRPVALVAVAMTVMLSACGALLHTEAVRLCRGLVPIFNGPADYIDIRRADAHRHADSVLIVVAYAVTREAAEPERRALSCIFREDGPAGHLDLTNLATEDGPVGDVRLHLIKRHWIDKGHAATNDPQPVALAPIVPDLSHAVAVPLQLLLSSLAGLGIYVLLALAYALIYGLVGRIHLGIGELAMLAGYGGFIGYWLSGGLASGAAALVAAALIGIVTAMIHGGALGHLVMERLRERPGQHILIATLGLSIAWSEAARLSQGSGQRWLSPMWSEPIAIARADAFLVTVTPMGLLVPALAAMLAAGCLTAMTRSAFGRQWRAVADDSLGAALLGIDGRAVLSKTMLLAATLAGAGGVLTLLAYGGIGHAGGLVTGLKALIAAVVGGIGSPRSAALGALAVGLGEIAWSHVVGIESRDLALFVALAVVLVMRPEGLFTRH